MLGAFPIRSVGRDRSAVALGVALPGGEVLDVRRFHVRLRVIAPLSIEAFLQAEVIFWCRKEWIAQREPPGARIDRPESDLLHLFRRLTER
ncbi:MAG: hypothetical protein KDA75_16510 [Planctomycetaceae bacterium]|nr:hypothetical protein [Planctomycetaceae bacterium]